VVLNELVWDIFGVWKVMEDTGRGVGWSVTVVEFLGAEGERGCFVEPDGYCSIANKSPSTPALPHLSKLYPGHSMNLALE